MSNRHLSVVLLFGILIVIAIYYLVSFIADAIQFGANFLPTMLDQAFKGNPYASCITFGLVIIVLIVALRVSRR